MIQYPENGWYSSSSYCDLVNAIWNVSQEHIAWLKFPELKYIEVRFDMRTGGFIVKDQYDVIVEKATLEEFLKLTTGESNE